jgi:radical SAM-linked protein
MIGLPGETDADVLGIADTCRNLQRNCTDLGRLELNLTISNFTPKPHTPFQWHSVSTAEFQRRQQLLREALRPLRGLKTNYTDVRLSAMEDFVGRGDRRLAPVIEAAWRSGAGLDAWFEAADRTYAAWTEAIEAAGLGGRYRALEMGAWSSTEALSSQDLEAFCAQPLPWDHIDSGVDKRWLADDLRQALAAAVVPDCSFEGCSSCGVCGPELGHNVVIPPPAIPEQLPQRPPASERVQRLRFRFAKTGSLALLSHLDLVRLMERALRRSGVPVSFTGGFHPLPRVQFALALPLGAEAAGEWMDVEMAEWQDPAWVCQRLQEQLPPQFALQTVLEVPVSGVSLSQELVAASWSLVLRPEPPVAASGSAPLVSLAQWQAAVDALLKAGEWIWEDTDKKGRPRSRDCRPYLQDLCVAATPDPAAVSLQYTAEIDAAGRSLRPEQLQHWFSQQLAMPLNMVSLRRESLQLHQG